MCCPSSCNGPQRNTGPSGPAPPNATTVPCPADESKTTGNRIDIVFDPDKSSKVTKCNKIVHVQFVRKHVNGKVAKPGDFLTKWKYRDDIMTDDGWGVDCLATETTPDYQQGTGNGKKNDSGVGKATMSDAPTVGDDTIHGAYDPKTNPGGWQTYRNEFATYAYCMEGDDCGKWYEGMTWEYNKTWEEHRDGKMGTSKITDKNVTSGPTASQLAAFEKFNKKHGYKPCGK